MDNGMNEIITAPIAVFCYNRVDVMKVLFQTLKKNTLAKESEVYIFCDGPKDSSVKAQTDEVRKFVHSIDGFKSIVIEESDTNRGLAPSIIYGVSKVLEKHDRVIVLEDDLILSTNFLEWMNQCLNKYRNNTDVFSVSGFTPSIMKAYSGEIPDSLFTMKAHSWGWATWKDRWEQVDWELKDWDEFSKSKKMQKEFATIGNEMPGLLFAHKEGKKSTWWARFCYSQFKLRKYTVYPTLSKVINEGFTGAATHCDVYNRYRVDFDTTNKKYFVLPDHVTIDAKATKAFFSYYSLRSRIIGKIKTLLMKNGFISQYSVDY